MELSRAALSAYDARLARQEDAAGRYVRERLEGFMAARPNAPVAEAREFAIEVCEAAAGLYGDAAAALAADLYEGLAEAAGEIVPAAQIDTSDVAPFVEKEAHYQAGKLDDGDAAGFVDGLADFASDQVARRANQTMRRSAARDGVRYARVPMGGETCTFCAMLASCGFVYHTEAAAGETNHYHRGCRCKVVPGFGPTSVQGYDPGEWHVRWQRFKEIDADGSMSEQEKRLAKRSALDSGPVFKAISRTHSMADDIAATNPKYEDRLESVKGALARCEEVSKRYGLQSQEYRVAYSEWESTYRDFKEYSYNCQRCVVAYEMRRRGYDVEAMPRILDGADDAASHWRDLFKGSTWEKAASKSDAENIISRMPQGARGTVYIVWEKDSNGRQGAHVFNFEKTESGVVYVDAQTGKLDASDHFARKAANRDLEVARIDNLDLNEAYAGKVLREAGGNE